MDVVGDHCEAETVMGYAECLHAKQELRFFRNSKSSGGDDDDGGVGGVGGVGGLQPLQPGGDGGNGGNGNGNGGDNEDTARRSSSRRGSSRKSSGSGSGSGSGGGGGGGGGGGDGGESDELQVRRDKIVTALSKHTIEDIVRVGGASALETFICVLCTLRTHISQRSICNFTHSSK
jgi:hypothetical protein